MNNNLIKIAGLLMLIILVSFLSVKIFVNEGSISNTTTLKDKVIEAGKIRAGYIVTTDQQVAKDPNTGELSGLYYEVTEELGKQLGLEIEWTEEVGWGTMIEGLNQGRYDIVGSPVWPNSQRALRADFSTPVTYNLMYAYARSNDGRLNKLEDINSSDIKVTVVDGSTGQFVASQRFPEAEVVSLPQLVAQTELLLNVSTNKADVVLVDPYVVNLFLENNPNVKFKKVGNEVVRVDGNSIVFNSGEIEFKNMVDIALREQVNNGFVDNLLKKYDKFGDSFFLPAPSYLTE